MGVAAWITTVRETVECFGPTKPSTAAKATTASRMINKVFNALIPVDFSKNANSGTNERLDQQPFPILGMIFC